MTTVFMSNRLVQKAVYWANPVVTEFGNTTFDIPIEVYCRWTDTQVIFIDPSGKEQVSKSVIKIDRDVKIGECLFLGTFEDLYDMMDSSSTTAITNPLDFNLIGVQVIRQYTKSYSLDGFSCMRTVWL